jgi:viroplasmin and RNaseH domain-containing protein
MKLTKQEAKLFKENHNKWLNEGNFLAKLFARRVAKAVENDKDIKKAVEDADKSLEQTRTKIEKSLSNNKEKIKQAIPSDVRKYLGFDY